MGPTQALLDALLAANIATGKILDPVTTKVGVATAVNDQGLNTTIGDITPAPGAVGTLVEVTTWAGPFRLNDGSPYVDGPAMQFTPASSADQCTVMAMYVVQQGTPDVLLEVVPIVPPIALADQHNSVGVVLRYVQDSLGRYDLSQIWDG